MKGQQVRKRIRKGPTDWRERLKKAKEHFGKMPNCLGVNYCEKRTGGAFTGEPAIVVYVRKKIADEAKISKKELIKKGGEFEGIATDVEEPFSEERPRRYMDYIADHYRSHDLAALDFGKIHRFHLDQVKALPAISRTGAIGEVFVIEDKEGRLITYQNGESVPDLVEAYQVFRGHYEDVFDFVTFFSDVESGMPTYDTSFHWGLYNKIKGIGRPDDYDVRGRYTDSKKLESIHFMHHYHHNRYVMLHEVGHRWAAFVRFCERQGGPPSDDLLIDSGAGSFHHWDEFFDNDRSPMDYDYWDWEEEPGGRNIFRVVNLPHSKRAYCNLDLYLMGLLRPDQVGSFYSLPNEEEGGRWLDRNHTRYQGVKKQLTVQNVIWAEGPRVPAADNLPKSFRQAFVLLTRNYQNATSLAVDIDRFRGEYVADFAEATRDLASVDTSLTEKDGKVVPQGGYVRQEYHRSLVIPDAMPGQPDKTVESTLVFAEPDIIEDIELSLVIKHTFVGDLRVVLVAPDDTKVIVRDNEGWNADDIDKTYTSVDFEPLKVLIGKKAEGPWTLKVTDEWLADEGRLEAWSLKLGFGKPEGTP